MIKNLICISSILITFNSFSAPIKDSEAIRAIVGESGNQGYKGMLAVAGAIRNRGTLKGVYGLNNPIVDKQPKYIFIQAQKAWAESKTNDITFGATHWENTKAFGEPYWAKNMTQTLVVKDHTFFKKKELNKKRI